MSAYERSYFARELNRMLEETGMSAKEIVEQVNQMAFPLPERTFTYWLQGYFLPRSDSAFQLVSALESIGGILDHRLSDALLQDLSSGDSFVPGESGQSELIATPPLIEVGRVRRFAVADKAIDWGANLIQKVVRDEVTINADHTLMRHKATVLARVPSVPNPTLVVQILHEDGATQDGEDFFYDLVGIDLKKQDVYDIDGATVHAAQFALPDDVVPGDLHSLSYSWNEVSPQSFERICDRYFPWILDFYSCVVTFEGDVPQSLRYVTLIPMDDKEIEVPCDIPVIRDGNRVSLSAKNFGNIIGYFCA